jgi:hypothetical protein
MVSPNNIAERNGVSYSLESQIKTHHFFIFLIWSEEDSIAGAVLQLVSKKSNVIRKLGQIFYNRISIKLSFEK